MRGAERSEAIKRFAIEEGFDRAGIARLGPSATTAALRRWLDDGRQAGMGYLERHVELREDPRRLLTGARSIVCLALRYPARSSSPEAPRAEEIWPRVARYARGEDYHDFLRAMLKRLAARIEREFAGAETRCCVDTAPLLEREWAARAGLGAVGKNTMLLHPQDGSWFLLGEILTTLDLEPDIPVADLCGDCGRCLAACPTGALVAPWELDSRLCISYWTIEHRGEIPQPMAERLAGWLFGCDVCQEVCPWNVGDEAPADPRFETPASRRGLDLTALAGASDEELRGTFRGTPLLRPQPEGLRRNARLALATPPPGDSEEPL